MTVLGRLIASIRHLLPSASRRDVTPLRSDDRGEVVEKWQRAATESLVELGRLKADRTYVDARREALSYEKVFPSPLAQWDIEVPNSDGLRVMSVTVLADLGAATVEVGEANVMVDTGAPNAKCSVIFEETVRGRARLQLG